MKKIQITLTLIICIFISSLLTACSNDKSVSKSGFYFDTVITITLYGVDDESYIDGCFDLASKYENLFSNSIDSSEISQINKVAGKDYAEVSQDTLDIISKSLDYCQLSDGKFDITIGKLSKLWNISEISETLEEGNEGSADMIPSDQDIKEALSHVDYKNIEIDGSRVILKDPDSQIDLGGIAKGYIADKMKKYLVDKGITSGIINLGGNVLTIGSKTDKSDFTIGIQYPFSENGATIATVSLSDKSVVTSGIYERYFTVDDKIYHHILDTSTGYPCDNDIASVTIISDESVEGDALSTTCFCLGIEDGLSFIENLDGVEAIFITKDNEFYYSSGIENYNLKITK